MSDSVFVYVEGFSVSMTIAWRLPKQCYSDADKGVEALVKLPEIPYMSDAQVERSYRMAAVWADGEKIEFDLSQVKMSLEEGKTVTVAWAERHGINFIY